MFARSGASARPFDIITDDASTADASYGKPSSGTDQFVVWSLPDGSFQYGSYGSEEAR